MDGVRLPVGKGIFFHHAQTNSGTHPIGTVALSPELKRLGRETDNAPPSSDDDKNVWRYTSTSSYLIMTWRLIKHRDKFTTVYLAAWSENCKWYSSLPLGAVVSLFCVSV
jgi:hypothetical protein